MNVEDPRVDALRTYSAEEAAPLLGLTPTALRQGAKLGRYAGTKIGGRWRFTAADIASIIADGRQQVQEDRARKTAAARRTGSHRPAPRSNGAVVPFTSKPGPSRRASRAS